MLRMRSNKDARTGKRQPANTVRLRLHLALPEVRKDAVVFVIHEHVRSLFNKHQH